MRNYKITFTGISDRVPQETLIAAERLDYDKDSLLFYTGQNVVGVFSKNDFAVLETTKTKK